MSSKKWFLLTIIIISLLVLRGCRDRVLPDRVINFTDSNTNKIISSVLVIPRYEVFWGMRNVEGGGSPVNYILLANPFIYHSDGSRFIIKQPRSRPALFIGFFVGKGVSTTGVICIAKGYEPIFINGDHLYSGNINSQLKPLNEKEAKEQLKRISTGFGNEKFEILLDETYENFLKKYDSQAYKTCAFKHNFTKKNIKMMKHK